MEILSEPARSEGIVAKGFRLLYLTAEQWPTFRPDIVALFGKYLPRWHVHSDLLTERDIAVTREIAAWSGGDALLCTVPRHRAGQYWVKFWHQVVGLLRADPARYDAIQVRDLPVIALWALLIARFKKMPFFYWMSFPQSEGQIARARARGPQSGMRYWFPLMQGSIGHWVLYRWVLPYADHVFVQSRRMAEDVAQYGIPMAKMTPVPMGVDLEMALAERLAPSNDPRLAGRRVVVYLGTLDRARQIEILFQMLALIRKVIPDILLVLAGDTEDGAHRDWLKQQAVQAGVTDLILWTGWLPAQEAWRYVRAAEVGLSPFPRGYLLDSASPTKAMEYMALTLPVVANDNPDQANVIAESGAGICVPFEPEAFASAVISLLDNPAVRQQMGIRGRQYIERERGYDSIAKAVADAYLAIKFPLLPKQP